MIWGMTLHPGVEYIREVTTQEYLTLASLDCRPQMNTEVYHPMAHLVVRVNNCEHVLCFLEKGLVHQQGLDFVFQEGDNLKLAVEGSGVVHITGYSVRHTMYEDAQDDRSVSSSVSAVPDGIQDDMEPPTLTFMGQPKINDKNDTTLESSLLEGRFRQSSVKVERGEKSDQSTRDQILYQDMNHEMTGGTFTYQNSIQVDSTLQKDTEMINQLQGANERVVDLENGHLQEMLPQITNIRTETFCTEDWNIEVEESCVESHLETNGEAMHHLGEATLTTISEHQSNHSINMSEEDTDNISHGDLSDEYSGEMTLYGITDRGCLETPVHCSSNEDILVSSDVTLPCDKQPAVLIPNLSNNDYTEGTECDIQTVVGEQKCVTKNQSEGDTSDVLPTLDSFQEETPSTSTDRSVQNEKRRYLKSGGSKTTCHPKRRKTNKENTSKSKLIGCERTPIYRKQYKCMMCEKTFKRRVSFMYHRKTHKGLKTHRCQSCNRLFSPKATLYNRKEAGDNLLKCQFCQKISVTKSETKIRQRSCPDPKVFRCQLCEKTFSSKRSLIIHKNIHMGTTSFQCQFCRKLFPQKYYLITHERIHTNDKPFKCQFCNRGFAQKGNMIFHEKRHTGEKPFKCQFCERRFVRKGNVAPHERIHTGERPFKCRFCIRDFVQKLHLTEHERHHTGEKPFRCQFCGKKFVRKGEVTRHERCHTGEKPYKCEVCNKGFLRQKDLIHHGRNHPS